MSRSSSNTSLNGELNELIDQGRMQMKRMMASLSRNPISELKQHLNTHEYPLMFVFHARSMDSQGSFLQRPSRFLMLREEFTARFMTMWTQVEGEQGQDDGENGASTTVAHEAGGRFLDEAVALYQVQDGDWVDCQHFLCDLSVVLPVSVGRNGVWGAAAAVAQRCDLDNVALWACRWVCCRSPPITRCSCASTCWTRPAAEG